MVQYCKQLTVGLVAVTFLYQFTIVLAKDTLKTYEYTLKRNPTAASYDLPCMHGNAIEGDTILYYVKDRRNSKPTLVKRVELHSGVKVESSHLTVAALSEKQTYFCEHHRLINGVPQPITRTEFKLKGSHGISRFVYEPERELHSQIRFGQPLVLSCPGSGSMNYSVDWYRWPGYKLIGYTEPTIVLKHTTRDDLGTYYCTPHNDEATSRISVAVHRFHIKTPGDVHVLKPAQRDGDRYVCPDVPNAWTAVTWEQPIGFVHLGQYGRTAKLESKSESHQVWCRYDIIQNFPRSHALQRSRREYPTSPLIKLQPRQSPESLTITIGCQWTVPLAEGQDVVYRWKKSWDDDMHEGQEFTTELIDPTLSHSVEKERRMVTCQVEDRTSGETLGSADVNLFPIPIRAIGIIDMKDGGRKLFSFEPEESVQIICDVDKQLVNNSKEVQWFFNSGPLREHVKRIDRLYVSMLILLNMSPEDEGVYTCGQKQRETQVHLIHKSVKLALELQPELDTQWANAGAATEFHCRLQGRKGGNQLIDWSFIPDGSETEVHLEPDVFVDRPDATPSTSFITIRNIQRHHGGTYVCRAFDLKQTARLVVRERGLTVTPETVDARPGTTVRFLCELSSIPGISGGKIFWMRTDRRDLRPGKEEVIGSSGGRALLIVKSLQWEDNNVTYVCSDGVSNVRATVFVRDACAPGFRSCNSRECVESNRFCDGNADCVDGSDEDPSKCLDCAPNEYACEVLEGKKPLRNCYLQYWHCDGEDDCGNNFDESACPPLSKPERCNGSHFVCPSSGKLIARSFMCDKTPDCEPDGEDEEECSLPTIIDPSGETQLFGLQSGTLTLTCTSYGRPPPAISWRFNWGGIREGVDHSVNTTVIDCNKVISHLTLHNLEPQASGLYTCEAVNRGRALAPDISVTVAKGGLCAPPNFNDGAWFEDMCLPCYCSGVSSECHSAKGYIKSPTPKFWNFAKVPWSIRVYSNGDALETDDGVESTDKLIRFTDRHEGNVFLEGAFGFQGSWVNSYGYHIKFKLRQFGSTSDFLPGPLLVLHSPNQSIYWCPPGDRIILYTLPVGYENELSVLLNERERWYLDANCSRRLKNSGGRGLFMSVLSEVERVGIRVKNYKTQVSTEVQDLVLDFAIKSDLPGVWIAEVEQCICPPGYEGLSCERCASGFEKDPLEIGRCRPKCACDKCDESGACLECPANRSGPRCQHCQPGFYRPGRSALSEDCIPCAKCVGPHVHVVKDCIGVSFTPDDHVCKCQPREDGKLLSPECDLCLVAQTQGTQPPPEANCEAKPQPLECNAIGTKTVSETQECTCYEGYEGPQCSHCSAGYFPYLNRCLQCFCAGQTSSCQLAEDYRFVNISLVNPVGVWSDIWLAKRTQSGGLERVEDTAAESPRVERTQTGFVVHRPLLEKGLVHLAIQLTQTNAAVPLSSDIPLYRFLYGGQMSFRLDSADLDPRLLTQGDARVVIELESARYGRVWTQAAFNIANQKYEVEFDENWWPGGWKLGTPSRIDGHGPLQGLTRGQLLRVLATTTSIGILTSSGKSEGPKGLRLFDIFMQIAVPTDHIAARAAGPALAVAPVERCDCPLPTQPGERKLSLSCEGCRDPKKQTVIRLEPLGEDFGCAECSGPSCDECPSGFFKYNVYTGERYETCQPSLIIETTPRTIIVEEGDPVSLFCRASSYRDGIVTHEWVAPSTVDRARLITSRRALPPTVSRLIKKQHAPNYTMQRSEAGLHLPAADKEDSGNYTCRATGVGAIVEEITYLLVRDKGPIAPLSVPEGDSLNKKYSINVPRNRESPTWATYQVEADPTDTGTTIVRAVADKPSVLASHQLLWLSANGTRIPSEELMVDEGTGVIQYRLSVPHESIERNEHAMQGYFVGTDPVANPYWTPMKQPEVTWRDKEEVLPPDIMKPPSEVRIPFMQPHVLEVKVKPGKSKIRVEWKKVNYTSEDTPRRYLPDGVEQDGDNLIFWAAASQHEGVYNGTVYRDSDGVELQHFNTTVHVDPLHHGTEKHLGRGEAVDLPEDIKDQEVEKAPVVWDFLVQGFTPEAEYCANPTWTLTDYQGGRTIDITDRVHRLSPTNFRVDYPLTSGIHLKFQCKPVPLSHLTGAILFNISSDDPRIVFQTVYDHPNSTFPTRLICLDLNPSLDSNVSITADSMRAEKLKDALVSVIQEGGVHQYGLLPRKVELDWRRIGGFDPFYDAGRFTCLVSNVETSGSKTVTVPEEKVPVEIPDDPSSRLYIYSPDAYVGSEVDGKAVVEVNEGGQLRLFCHYDSRPMEDFHGWSSESPIVQSHTQITMRQSSSLANFSIVPLELDEQTLECKVKDKVKSVQLKVVPKGKTRMLIRLASEALIDGRIAAVTGQDMELRCEVKHITSPPVSIDRIDWYLQYGNGVRRAVGSSGLAESIELEDRGRILRFTGLSKTPTGAKIFCVVRPTDVHTAVQAYYRSQLVDFWIRRPKLIATIQPVDPHGFVVGVEGGTIRLHCATKDVWRNKTMDKLNVTWETRIMSAKGSLPLTDSDRPWKVTKPLNSYFFIAGLQWTPNRVGHIRCRAEDPFSGVFAFSDWTPINVLQEKIVSQTPRLRIIPAVNPTFPFYPTKVECVDDNLEIPSEVMWTRQTGPIAPDQVDSRPNSATITWKVGDAAQFDPFTHADVYTCTATNAHSSTSQQYFFPDEMMPKEPIPFGEHKLIISSSINDLFHETDGSYTRVVQGHPFELLCTYYGYPSPPGGLLWSVEHVGGTDRSTTGSEWMAAQGLRVRAGRRYWTQVSTDRFDETGKHAGIFRCAALNADGTVYKQTQVRVELYKVIVKVNELADSGLIDGVEGQSGTISCGAYDGYHNFILPGAVYSWEFEKLNGHRVHPNLLATKVIFDENRVNYEGLSPASAGIRARCVATNNSARYVSPDFGFRVRRLPKGAVIRPEIEHGGRKWVKGDGSEGVLLVVSGTNEITGHVSISEGDSVNLTCIAIDAVTKKRLIGGDFSFGWRMFNLTGEPVAASQLTEGSLQTQSSSDGDAGYFLIDAARTSPAAPRPTTMIECLATKRREAVTYYSSTIDYVVYPKEVIPDYEKERRIRNERNNIQVKVDGLDSRGMLFANEGSVKRLICEALDRSKGSKPMESAQYSWEFSRLDGSSVDTAVLVQPNFGEIHFNGSQVMFRGLRRESAARGRCKVVITDESTGEGEREMVHYSPYFKFDVIDDSGLGHRVFIPPAKPEALDGLVGSVAGLDENGYLTSSPGEDFNLSCIVMNASTGETFTSPRLVVHYGWEFQQSNGLPASTLDVAESVQTNEAKGELKMMQLRTQPDTKPTRGRCVIELIPVNDQATLSPTEKGFIRRRFSSPYFLINVPPKDEIMPDYADTTHQRYELNVQGLNEFGALPLRLKELAELTCLVRDTETDTLMDILLPSQAIGWQLPVHLSGQVGNLGDVARRVRSDRTKLYLDDIREDVSGGLRGRCWFFDGLVYYYSPYFPIVQPHQLADARVTVEVREVGTEDDRRYVCTAYDSNTGAVLHDVSYDWSFTAPTGELVMPSYYMESVETQGNLLAVRPGGYSQRLPANLRGNGPIEGRCLVLYQTYTGNLTKPDTVVVYGSRPFILIDPEADDPDRVLIRPEPYEKSRRVVVKVEGLTHGIVSAPESGTVTLTCKAIDTQKMSPIADASYRWEIQQRDGSPVSTSFITHKAVLVQKVPFGSQLTLVGLRPKAAGARGRCIVANTSATPAVDSLITPGTEVASPFFEFQVHRTPLEVSEYPHEDYEGHSDFIVDGDSRLHEVVVVGLDEKGRLVAKPGDDVKLEIKLKDVITGEIKSIQSDPRLTHVGLETRYDNGQSAPLSLLAEAITVHGQDGAISLSNFSSKSHPPIQIRVLVEREEEVYQVDDEGRENLVKKRSRYASTYIDVVPLMEGEEEPPVREDEDVKIYPVVDGLNRCGHLPLVTGTNVSLVCRPNDTRVPLHNLIYGWEFRHKMGQALPPVNLIARGWSQQGSRLRLTGLLDPGLPLIGRCIVAQTTGRQAYFYTPYFPVGPHGPGCDPDEPLMEPEVPGELPILPEKKYRIRIRIEGLSEEGDVVQKPGSSITLKCTALNATTNEPVLNTAIGWDFVSDTGEALHTGQLASRYELGTDNALYLTELRENPNAHGRCMVTLEQRVTLSSPYFLFDIKHESAKPITEQTKPLQSDKRVRVEIVGLSGKQRITVSRVGDASSLRCQAVVVATSAPLLPIQGTRYGWEWRYLDEDPIISTDVALSVETRGEKLHLLGIQAPPGNKGRNVKGRCVVHVPGSQVDSTLPGDSVLVYGSDYFTVDVVKKPTALDPDTVPIPGRPQDGIQVHVLGLDDDGNLSATEKESVAVICEARNATTGERLSTEGLRAEYSVAYGWLFADATGRSVDSSLFADSISADTSGSLRLRGLAAPTRGELPFKIRCRAIVSRHPSSPGEPVGPARSYESDYFALNIKRPDGSSTMDVDKDAGPPDISGKRITLTVDGLKPDGRLASAPGVNASLKCLALDTETGQIVHDLMFGWEFRHGSGSAINVGLLANSIVQDGNELHLIQLKRSDHLDHQTLGRCIAHRGRHIYRSDYFRIEVAPVAKGEEVEGDGRILVNVDGVEPKTRTIQLEPRSVVNLTCIAKDATTKEPVTDVKYSWEFLYSPSTVASEVKGSLGTFVETVQEQPDGALSLTTSDTLPTDGYSKLRCRIKHGTSSYTSQFYRLLPHTPDQPPHEPERPVYPKFRVEVEGLDESGLLSGETGSSAILRCNAYDGFNGTRVDDVQYYWEFRRVNEDPVVSDELVSLSLNSSGNQLHLVGLKSISKTVKGRCIVKDRIADTWDYSTYFLVQVPVDGDAAAPVIEADFKEGSDDLIAVNVGGLDESGNLIRKIGENAELVCNTQVKEGVEATILSRGWKFLDGTGRSVPLSHLADELHISNEDGKIQLTNLRLTQSMGVDAVKGHCVVRAEVMEKKVDADGTEQQGLERLSFISDNFGVSITEDGTAAPNPGGKDVRGEKVMVTVEGLDQGGTLSAGTGDKVTLKCIATDKVTNESVSGAIYRWDIQDSTGAPVTSDQVAHRMVMKHDFLELWHLKPSDKLPTQEQRVGRCVVYDPANEHFYSSRFFHVNVRSPSYDDIVPSDSPIDVQVRGPNEDDILVAKEGETVTLECQAFDKRNQQWLAKKDTIYQFYFEDASRTDEYVYGGHIADHIEQVPLEDGGVKLTLHGVKSGGWHRGRCVVLRTPKKNDTEPTLAQYTSKYFWSGVDKSGDPPEDSKEHKQRIVEFGGFTYDPNVLVKVEGVKGDETISAKSGDKIVLVGYAIDAETGKPIEGMRYSWEFRSVDGLPIVSTQLANGLEVGEDDQGQILRVNQYNPTGNGITLRCIASATDAVKDAEKRGRKYASRVYTFQTLPTPDEDMIPAPEPRKEYNPETLKLEVVGLNPDGTLSRKEGENANLSCRVIDLQTESTMEDEFSLGWSIGTGPDNRPVPLNDVAKSVSAQNGNLDLIGLKRTQLRSGGLRSYCVLTLRGAQLEDAEKYPHKTVQLESDSFVIYVDPQDDMPAGEPDTLDRLPYIHWIPGKDAKSAVLVKVFGLDQDNSVKVYPGGNVTISCAALDGVSLQRISSTEVPVPLFTWELRDHPGGNLLDYNHLSNGLVRITQPGPGEDESNLELHTIRRTPELGPEVAGRCSVRLNDQVFRSEYFRIEIMDAKRMMESKVSPEDYWAQDGKVKVTVRGLDQEGNLVGSEGSNLDAVCEAVANGTDNILTENKVTYGWQFLEPTDDVLMSPLAETSHLSGPVLQLRKLALLQGKAMQFTLRGWCLVDVSPRDQVEDVPVKHYRSNPFNLIVNSATYREDDTDATFDVAKELFIRVDGVSEDGMLKAKEGEDKVLDCIAIETSTGFPTASPEVTYGWEWRSLDGDVADISMLASDIASHANKLQISALKPTTPVKGRCVVVAPSPLEILDDDIEQKPKKPPQKYLSDFFFVSVEPADPKTEHLLRSCRPVEAKDAEVKVTIWPGEEETITLQFGSQHEFIITATRSDGSSVQTMSTGYELAYLSGEPAPTSEIAKEVSFSVHRGTLNMKDIQYPTKPLKLRAFVHVSTTKLDESNDEDQSAKDKSCSPIIYRSEYMPINVLTPEGESQPPWIDRLFPIYDASGDAYKVTVLGLDDDGNAAAEPGGTIELTCSVHDKFGFDADLEFNGYSWVLLNGSGHLVSPSALADKVEIIEGKTLRVSGYHPSAYRQGIRGRCVINIPVPVPVNATLSPDVPPTQRFISPYFTFTQKEPTDLVDKPETETPTPSEHETTPPVTDGGRPATTGFTLVVDSPSNPVYETKENKNIVLARIQRPFELNCRAVFDAESGPPLSSIGEPLPRLVWYYRQPEIPGDVPIPSQLFPVRPPRMETLQITSQSNSKISIQAESYSFRDDMAEFHCRAYMESDDIAEERVVYIQKIQEKYNVRIFDEDSRGRVYAFVGVSKTLTCYVDDIATGDRVEPSSYQWEISTGEEGGEWLRGNDPRQPAKSISGWTNNQLVLESLTLPVSGNTAESTYEFRCTVKYNETFDTISRPFVMNIRTKPRIRHILIDREKPIESALPISGALEDSYDATQDYQLGCKPEIIGGEAVATWQKCLDDQCEVTKDLLPTGDKMFLFANSTRYTDEGLFRCQVSLQLKEYNFKLTETREITIKRMAAPAIYSGGAVAYTVNDEMSLQCTDESSSPEATVKWSFEPSGESPPERKNPIQLGKTYAYGRIYIFAVARGQLMTEHSGTYTCTAANAYGSASSAIMVKVTEEAPQGVRRSQFRRWSNV